MENVKVHDNDIVKYSVDFEKKEIILNTKNEAQEFTDIIFTDVLACLFEDTIMGSTILDLEEWPAEDLISCLGESYIMDHKNYDWPFEFKDIPDFIAKVKEKKISIYCLAASYGMSGFILAKSVKYLAKKA